MNDSYSTFIQSKECYLTFLGYTYKNYLLSMFPFILRALQTYAPYITLPVAAVIGVIGYKVESMVSDKYTPYQDSIENERTRRLLQEEDLTKVESLKEKKFVPTTIFDKNVSPSLKDP